MPCLDRDELSSPVVAPSACPAPPSDNGRNPVNAAAWPASPSSLIRGLFLFLSYASRSLFSRSCRSRNLPLKRAPRRFFFSRSAHSAPLRCILLLSYFRPSQRSHTPVRTTGVVDTHMYRHQIPTRIYVLKSFRKICDDCFRIQHPLTELIDHDHSRNPLNVGRTFVTITFDAKGIVSEPWVGRGVIIMKRLWHVGRPSINNLIPISSPDRVGVSNRPNSV
ncbi:hypothetical protein F5Y15DRAFT_113627 [Xylariaceae sp. FL0016]|nr:hypothetical protein F5Y15DRAFT_113627 [Xylariaceae sp. FL0016]